MFNLLAVNSLHTAVSSFIFETSSKAVGQQATSSYLKDLQQSLHVKTADAKGNPEDGWHYNEDQQQGEPHGEGDAQQDAHQVIKRVEEELHLKSQSGD